MQLCDMFVLLHQRNCFDWWIIGPCDPCFHISLVDPRRIRAVGQGHRSHFIIITAKAQVHPKRKIYIYLFSFNFRAQYTMGQCGITSSKTVLVFLNLIFWVRRQQMFEVCANILVRPGMERISKLTNCARNALRFGDRRAAFRGQTLPDTGPRFWGCLGGKKKQFT